MDSVVSAVGGEVDEASGGNALAFDVGGVSQGGQEHLNSFVINDYWSQIISY